VSSGPVAAGLGFGGLDERIDASIRLLVSLESNALRRLGQCFIKHLGHRVDRLQAATARPAVPSAEERLGLRRALSAVEDLA